MLKSRLRMFLNELKLLVLTGGGRPRAEPQPRGGGGGGCGWAPFAGCSARDGDGDEEEYYGSEPRARGLAGDKEPRAGPPPPPAPPPPPPGALDALSLSSSLDSGLRTPQCRICFQGPEQVRPEHLAGRAGWGRTPGVSAETGAGGGAREAGRDPGPEWEWGEVGLAGDSWSVSRLGRGGWRARGSQSGWGFLLGGLRISVSRYHTALSTCSPHLGVAISRGNLFFWKWAERRVHSFAP